MYGTIARFRVKEGSRSDMLKLLEQDNELVLDGWVADYVFQTDKDGDEFFLVAFFKDRESYADNADSPEQNQRYIQWRAMLVDDPEWNDGSVVIASGPRAHR
jgi:heme-degrading monooxygenase HmoA